MLFTTFILDTFILSIISNSVANIINSPSASEQNITTDIFVRDFDQSQVESSSAHVAPPQHRDKVLIEKRYLRSSGSEQDLVKSKELVQFDDVSQGTESHIFFHKESAIFVTTLGSDSHDATAELTTRRRRLTQPEDAPDDGLFGKTHLPIEARKYLRDNSTNHSSILYKGAIFSRGLNKRSHGVVLDWAKGADVPTKCPDTSGSRKVSYADLRDAAEFAYKNNYSSWKGWQEIEHIEENWYFHGIPIGSSVAKIVAREGVIALAFRGSDDLSDWVKNVIGKLDIVSRDGVDVHGGFLKYLEVLEPDIKTTRDWLKGTCGIDFDFVTGHSLGGAAASLYGQFNADVGGLDGEGEKGIVTFGAPRTHFTSSAAYACELKGARFYHSKDWVTGLPIGNWYHALPVEKYENPCIPGYLWGEWCYDQDPSHGVGLQCSCDSACHCGSLTCACSRPTGYDIITAAIQWRCLEHGLSDSWETGDGYSWWIPEDKMRLPSPAPSPPTTPRPTPRPTRKPTQRPVSSGAAACQTLVDLCMVSETRSECEQSYKFHEDAYRTCYWNGERCKFSDGNAEICVDGGPRPAPRPTPRPTRKPTQRPVSSGAAACQTLVELCMDAETQSECDRSYKFDDGDYRTCYWNGERCKFSDGNAEVCVGGGPRPAPRPTRRPTPRPTQRPSSGPVPPPTSGTSGAEGACANLLFSGSAFDDTHGTYVMSGTCNGQAVYDCYDCAIASFLWYDHLTTKWHVGEDRCGSADSRVIRAYDPSPTDPTEASLPWKEENDGNWVENGDIRVICKPTPRPTSKPSPRPARAPTPRPTQTPTPFPISKPTLLPTDKEETESKSSAKKSSAVMTYVIGASLATALFL